MYIEITLEESSNSFQFIQGKIVLVSVPICHSLMMEDGFVKMAAVREKGSVCSESCAGKRGSFVCRGALQSRAQLFKTNDVVS